MDNSSSAELVIMEGSDGGNLSQPPLSPLVCYAPTMISMGGIWKGDNPLDFSFPLFLLQLVVIVLTTRATTIILQPLNQPRYLAQIIGGLMLGPCMMGQIPNFGNTLFPLRSVIVLETMANLGLIYFIFIVGIEIDETVMQRSTQSVSFAAACIGFPFLVGVLAVLFRPHKLGMETQNWAFLLFLCAILSITAFSVLARSLAELKLLNTSLGATALTAAMHTDTVAWVLLALVMTFAQGKSVNGVACTLISIVAFYVVVVAVVRPAIQWVIRQTPEGEEVDDFYACVILVTVLVMAFVTDAIGIHAISGAFILGLAVPNGPLGEALIERIEDFVEGLLLPLFFATSGLKMDYTTMRNTGVAVFLSAMVVVGTVAKVGGCVVVARLYDMSMRDGLAMGLLMNTKGVIEMVLLNVGKDRQLLSDEGFSVLVCLSIVITAITTPLLRLVVRPSRRLSSYVRRTVQWPKPDPELRVLICGHVPRHTPTALALLDAINPTKRSPITVFALHLIELTSRASAMMIVSSTTSKEAYAANPFGTSYLDGSTNSGLSTQCGPAPAIAPIAAANARSPTDNIMLAFESYEQHTAGVSVQHLTAVSPYGTMHRDVCVMAEENRAALILLPFHKQQTVDGGMEATNLAIRILNRNILCSAPCSVAILVDRGLRTASRLPNGAHHHVTLLFLGGPDDREAVSIAARMVEHPGISLTVLRLVAAEDSPKASYDEQEDRERRLDDDCIGDFRLRFVSYKSVTYTERVASNGEETVEALREATVDKVSDLFIVGKGRETETALTAGLTEWSECPELGPIGDLLASTDFGATVSVLVVQQCREKMKALGVEEISSLQPERDNESGYGYSGF